MLFQIDELQRKAKLIRSRILEMVVSANKGHIGGAFSCSDILVALYYGGILRYDPGEPDWSDRDRFILSKGHSCVALYAILADLGYFPLHVLSSFCQNGSMLGGHPDRNIPGVEVDTGSLGHGLGVAAGLAMSAKMGKRDCLTIVLLGDGECYEGSVWEAALFSAHHELNNLVVIVDRNRQCATDFTEDCNRLDPLADKWRAFNWDVREINGHSFVELMDSMKDLRSRRSSRPLAVIANTVKGKGVSLMEGKVRWHHCVPSGENLDIARKEICQG